MKRNKFQILLMITLVLSFFCAGCDLPIEFGYSNVTDDLGDPVIKDDSSTNDESNKDDNNSNEEVNNEPNNENNNEEKVPENVETSLFKTGRITTQYTEIETEHFIFKIDANVYLPPYLEENIEIIYDTLEIVSGLDFYNEIYNPGKITIEVGKDYNANSPEHEYNKAYAYSSSPLVHVSPGYLLLGNTYGLVHELSHTLNHSQSEWYYNQVYGEGFAEYTSYKASSYLEKHNIAVAKTIETSKAQIGNMSIYGNIYSQPVEYWIENNSEASTISGNGAYSVGFRFMKYLDDTYGDYTEWINYYENKKPRHQNNNIDQRVVMYEQLNAMKKTYGEDVFDNFYKWLKLNEDFFKSPWDDETNIYDVTKLDKAYIYPYFVYRGDTTTFVTHRIFKYNDLYIDIDELKNYLVNYKNKDITNLKLVLEKEVKVELYDKDNNLIEAKIDDEFLISNVSYIKLVGENTLGSTSTHGLEIVY